MKPPIGCGSDVSASDPTRLVGNLRAGETLRVHPGHAGAFQTSVSFHTARIPGIDNMIFGGDRTGTNSFESQL
jgi:uncharacterized protein (AIM24 family)